MVVAMMKKLNKYADEEEVEDDKDNYEDEDSSLPPLQLEVFIGRPLRSANQRLLADRATNIYGHQRIAAIF